MLSTLFHINTFPFSSAATTRLLRLPKHTGIKGALVCLVMRGYLPNQEDQKLAATSSTLKKSWKVVGSKSNSFLILVQMTILEESSEKLRAIGNPESNLQAARAE